MLAPGHAFGGQPTGGLLPFRRHRVLEIEDHHIGGAGERLGELALGIRRSEQQRAHDQPDAAGRLRMKAWRWQTATSVPSCLKARCSKSTMPASGRDLLSRLPFTSVSTRMVSP